MLGKMMEIAWLTSEQCPSASLCTTRVHIHCKYTPCACARKYSVQNIQAPHVDATNIEDSHLLVSPMWVEIDDHMT